jgi:hypothetical protein
MKWAKQTLAIAAAVLSTPAPAMQGSLLHDPVALNIGINCSWQARCMARQRRAMKSALSFVAREHPPHWRVQLCNRNAGRGGARTDWVGFDHCIRNSALRPPAARSSRKRRR